MKTLNEYKKEAQSQLVDGQTYFTTDISIRMQILAMKDFIDDLKETIPQFSFDREGNLYVKEMK